MKTFGKIIICIIVVVVAILIASLIFDKGEKNTTNTGTNVSNTESKLDKENKDYIGLEEKQEEAKENEEEPKEDEEDKNAVVVESKKEEDATDKNEEQEEPELTGKDKAIDIVKKKYATDGQTVRFDHMEGENYIIKINDGTAVTWYLVNGAKWEAEEY